MPRTPFTSFASPYAVLPNENIDTDQIIPARFLKTTERSGLGALAFYDWRTRPDGTPDPAFILERPEAREAKILVAGRNFGCGSSREHAVWALLGAGIRAVVSTELADIFRGNALGNGLLPIQVEPAVAERLMALAPNGVGPSLTVDLEAQTLTLPDGTAATFPIPPFAKHCLLNGIDELEFLLGASEEIAAYEAAHPQGVDTRKEAAVAASGGGG
jgi:3-isopropylmalate/(R)-2-methylmalate dehydratase small subunit